MTDRTFLHRSLLGFVGDALGAPPIAVRDLSWTSRPPAVLELRLADGRRAVAKLHDVPDKHRREVAAYRAWGPRLAPELPRLLAVRDAPPRAILLQALPGRTGPEATAEAARADDPTVHAAGGPADPDAPWLPGLSALDAVATIGWAARHGDASLEAQGRLSLRTVLDEAR